LADGNEVIDSKAFDRLYEANIDQHKKYKNFKEIAKTVGD